MVKREFDLLVSLLLLIPSLPIMAILALLIRLDSEGAAVFRQQRVGENGRLFGMYKFRTMVAGADQNTENVAVTDEQGQIVHKHKDNPRVTRIGRLMRRFSLDELPQLFNVLNKGK